MQNSIDLSAIKHVHMVGVGGSGMGGIAEILLKMGFEVTGSDLHVNAVTQRLEGLGIHYLQGHDAAHVNGVDVMVCSTAIQDDNPEIKVAKARGIPVVKRAQMLAALMQRYEGIAIAGTHGKTTTTGLVASMLSQSGIDPTFIIGGWLKTLKTSAQLGQGRYFLAEADESDASFLHLSPKISVVTNIDADHLEHYQDDFALLKQAFLQFLEKLPADGLAILCIDDPVVCELLPQIKQPYITYGFDERADIQATQYRQEGQQNHFTVAFKDQSPAVKIELNLAGRHNVLNALAAIGIARRIGLDDQTIHAAFREFQGVGRRFQVFEQVPCRDGKVTVVDDYGHHPREVAVTLDAARKAWPDKRLVLVFQPHRYSRTRNLWDHFVRVLSQADQLVLLDIYSAGEAPINQITGEALCAEIAQYCKQAPIFVKEKESLLPTLMTHLCDGDLVLMQGAGSIGVLASEFINQQ